MARTRIHEHEVVIPAGRRRAGSARRPWHHSTAGRAGRRLPRPRSAGGLCGWRAVRGGARGGGGAPRAVPRLPSRADAADRVGSAGRLDHRLESAADGAAGSTPTMATDATARPARRLGHARIAWDGGAAGRRHRDVREHLAAACGRARRRDRSVVRVQSIASGSAAARHRRPAQLSARNEPSAAQQAGAQPAADGPGAARTLRQPTRGRGATRACGNPRRWGAPRRQQGVLVSRGCRCSPASGSGSLTRDLP